MIRKNMFDQKNAPKVRFVNETICPAGKTQAYQTKCAAGQIKSLDPQK